MNILFACAGNTCRSVMAQHLLAEKLRLAGRTGLEVRSCGLLVEPFQLVHEHAVAVLKERGLDAAGQVPSPAGPDHADWADLVLLMTQRQKLQWLERFPSCTGRVFTLGEYARMPGDIKDPWGGTLADYRLAAETIERALDLILPKIE